MAVNTKNEILSKKHTRFFMMSLALLPPRFITSDSQRMFIGYACIAGCDVLGTLEETVSLQTRREWALWIKDCLHTGDNTNEKNNDNFNGNFNKYNDEFGYGFAARPGEDLYPNIAMTFFAICILGILARYEEKEINNNNNNNNKNEALEILQNLNGKKILEWIKKCQRNDGSVSGQIINGKPFGEHDLRFVYCSSALISLFEPKYNHKNNSSLYLDKEKTINYIKNCTTYEGGLSETAGAEAHAGLTYCGIASLILLNKFHEYFNIDDKNNKKTIDKKLKNVYKWLLDKQFNKNDSNNGGFCGRTNKLEDTCYCFWCSASLFLLDQNNNSTIATGRSESSYKLNSDYLVNHVQNKIIGGFGKDSVSNPDPYHTFLAILSLSIDCVIETKIDVLLCLRKESADFLRLQLQ